MKPQILPEDLKLNWLTAKAMEERLNHSTSRLIWGEGNPTAPLFVVLDNPGARENKDGVPYLCGTRATLLNTLLDVGIELEQIYVSFFLKSRPLKKYNKEMARATSLLYLRQQIELHKSRKAKTKFTGNFQRRFKYG
ncbi:MAG TPA: hypothetical protein GXZ55_05925 [Natronincola sp.]|nr:hypothetical protein [Natronincola sp.]